MKEATIYDTNPTPKESTERDIQILTDFLQ